MSDYWKNWPGPCDYNNDLKWASTVAINYLRSLAPLYNPKSPKFGGITGMVVFDLDDTLFMGDPENIIGIEEGSLGMHKHPIKGTMQEAFILPPNDPIVQIANEARKLGFKIVCITARPPESEIASDYNLKLFKIPKDILIMNNNDDERPFFKVDIRKAINSKPKQKIVMTVGDRFTDVLFPGDACAIKLPEPESKCAYAYIP